MNRRSTVEQLDLVFCSSVWFLGRSKKYIVYQQSICFCLHLRIGRKSITSPEIQKGRNQ